MRLYKLLPKGRGRFVIAGLCVVAVGVVGAYVLTMHHESSWRGLLEVSGNDSGYCLTASGGNTGDAVVLDTCSKTADDKQVWVLADTKTVTILGVSDVQEFSIMSAASNNECLNSANAGVEVQLSPCNSSNTAGIWLWGAKLGKLGFSAHQLVNVSSIGGNEELCLDHVSSTAIQGITCQIPAQTDQEWFEAEASSFASTTGSADAANAKTLQHPTTGPSKSTASKSTATSDAASGTKSTRVVAAPIHYAALGDSVASGEGINYGWVYTNSEWKQTGPQNPTWEPTNNLAASIQDCHRSAKAYPYLISNVTKYKLLDLSCSGASIPNGVLGPIQFSKTTTGAAQLGNNQARNAAYDTFKPSLVTITLGMDDIDFSDVVATCYTGPCGTASQNNSIDSAIAAFSSNLKGLLGDINSRGKADGQVPWVVLTTYYDPFNLNSLSCDDVDIGLGFGLSSSDAKWLQSKLNLINEDIKVDGSSYPKSKVVDLTNVLNGHQLCSSSPWVYGPSILYDDLDSPAPFHPTPSGQQAIANAMLSTIGSLKL